MDCSSALLLIFVLAALVFTIMRAAIKTPTAKSTMGSPD
jgi:hypothetical protein